MKLGEYDIAIAAFEKLSSLIPSLAALHRASLLFVNNKHEEALNIFSKTHLNSRDEHEYIG